MSQFEKALCVNARILVRQLISENLRWAAQAADDMAGGY
jgi:hypothetical protein